MGKKLYISDLHFGHGNLNTLMDNRGFTSVEEMNDYMIQQWNKTVKTGDEVYILGDLIWKYDTNKIPDLLLSKLHGKKYLILGNHDNRWISNFNNEKQTAFRWIKDYAEIKDNGRTVILSHYPIMTYNHQFNNNSWMLHGHVHVTKDAWLIEKYKEICKDDARYDSRTKTVYTCPVHIINCFCMFSDYMPLTLDEWIQKEQSGEMRKILEKRYGSIVV